jgi:hypothetical protein
MGKITEEKIEELAGMIVYTDWYYHYSDDYSVWKSGESRVSSVKKTFRETVLSEIDVENLKNKVLEKLQRTHSSEGAIREDAYKYFMEKLNYLIESKV